MAEGEPIHCPACLFWVEHDPDGDSRAGRCHREAPRPLVQGHGESPGVYAAWPETYDFDWCGAAEPRDG